MDNSMQQQIEQMIDYIMKKCLWQFHSRSWDRERQNAQILGTTFHHHSAVFQDVAEIGVAQRHHGVLLG